MSISRPVEHEIHRLHLFDCKRLFQRMTTSNQSGKDRERLDVITSTTSPAAEPLASKPSADGSSDIPPLEIIFGSPEGA